MRGKTAKRIRRLARRVMFKQHLDKTMPLPRSAAEADFQLKQVSKELKRRWRLESNPHSLAWVDEQ